MTLQQIAKQRLVSGIGVFFSDAVSRTEARRLQRLAASGELQRIAPGIYVQVGDDAATAAVVRQNWQRIAGHIAAGAVVSHVSALTKGLSADGSVVLSHPTQYGKTITLPGVQVALVKGPSNLPGDLALGDTGLYWASQARMLLENIGKAARRRAGLSVVEEHLVSVLNASGEDALNRLRKRCADVAPLLGAQRAYAVLSQTISSLLGTHSRGQLKTRQGILVASGTPVDAARLFRFEQLAQHLRTVALPSIQDVAASGLAKGHFAFVESFFSNYVEGTKFDIERAADITLRNLIVDTRPKDSHDVLGVFKLAMNSPTRNAPPAVGPDFLSGLQAWHAVMMEKRPEVRPGEIKLETNFAGTTRFVDPGMVRGTAEEASRMAVSVPEGLARAIFYAFCVSEIHPFDDGNGRVSRLVMNAELSRMGLCRIIIPTLFHPQYVDCAKQLTQNNDPVGFVSCLAKMALWCARFDYADETSLIAHLKQSHALEESPIHFKLLNPDGTVHT